MKSFTTSFTAFLASATVAAAKQSPKLEWKNCADLNPQLAPTVQLIPAFKGGLQCANLSVPLDYKDTASNASVMLNLVRTAAVAGPSKGSILVNPGGPGEGARNAFINVAPLVSEYSGGHFDIVTWNTRGTGFTLPANCFASDLDRQLIASQQPDVSQPDELSLAKSWGANGRLALACEKSLAKTGDLIGSAYSARDMAEIVDALGEDGLLRYYGISYGSALGQIFAAMFPDKVDRLVIDGVLNPHQYITGLDYQQLADTETVLDGFLTTCMSNPAECPLAKRDTSTKNIRQQVLGLFGQLENNPYAYGPGANQYLDAFTLRTTLGNALYSPTLWKNTSIFLDAVLADDKAAVAKAAAFASTSLLTNTQYFPELDRLEMLPAIRCSDVMSRLDNVSQAIPIVQAFFDQSPHFGGTTVSQQYPLRCGQWPFKAKEQYTGNFDVATKNPILVINNVFDPITSLDAAKNASATFKGSGLLMQQDYGHTTQVRPSKCIVNAVAAYFNDGRLPKAGTICLPDTATFPDHPEV